MATPPGEIAAAAESTEIKVLKRVVWRTAVAGRVERFAALLEDPERQKFFGDEYVKQVSAKIDRLGRLLFFIAAIYAVLMLSLYAAQDQAKAEFQILGFSFKNLWYFKEFLLLAAVTLSPISTTVTGYRRYLIELRQAVLRKMYPDRNVLEFAEHLYADKYFDPLLKDGRLGSRQPHGVATAIVAIFGLAVGVVVLTLLFASIALQFVVIYDVATHPSAAPVVNTAIVAFSISAIALSWLIGAMQLPMPEVDYEGYLKLAQLKEQAPEKYQETIKRISAEAKQRQTQLSTVLGVGAFALVYAICAAFWGTQLGIWQAFGKAIPALGLTAAIAPSVAAWISRRIYRRYFQKYPGGEADKELKAFKRATRIVSACRVAAFLALALVCSYLTLHAK